MSLVLDAVAGGFGMANRRIPLILADIAAKLLWLVVTGLTGLMACFWFLSRLSPPPGVSPELSVLYVAAALEGAGPLLLRGALLTGLLSMLVWSVLEAFVRSRLFRRTSSPALEPRATFVRFLASGALRRVAFALMAGIVFLVVMGPGLTSGYGQWSGTGTDLAWGVLGGALLLAVVAFGLMVMDTLLRCDAIEALGRHLGPIVLAVGAIGVFEMIIRAWAVAATVILTSLMPSPAALLVAIPAGAILLSIVHSYLLLVRYSAIGIIRRHANTVSSTHNGPSYTF